MKTPVLDLAIVGAGLAGLAAARRAQELGLEVEIFEASDGVGGRVRSDQVGGFICDRGFQLINPAYPDLARYYRPDRFHHLEEAIDVVIGERSYRLGDPRIGLSTFAGNLSPATGSVSEKFRFLRYVQGLAKSSPHVIAEDHSFEDEMLSRDIGAFYSRVIGPFASGVFLNLPSRISARVARELIHYFLIGKPGVPVGGVGEVTRTLASGLTIHLDSAVDELGDGYLRLGRRRIKARAVIVATDLYAAKSLFDLDGAKKRHLSSSTAGKMSGSTTWYHSVKRDDFPGVLRIDGNGAGPVTNTIAISRLAPEYAPQGMTLISTTVMSAYGQEVSESRVRKHLAHLWRSDTSNWDLVAKYAIAKSLPLMNPGVDTPGTLDLSLTPRRGRPGMLRYLAGDFLALPAQQGAAASGIKAVEEIADRL
jgi:phytoene dehydrogenase-like protein